MSAPLHTPGPWYARGLQIFKDYGDKRHPIAACEDWAEDTPHNAAVLAAAPELFDVVVELTLAWRESSGFPATVMDAEKELARINAAAAKARALIDRIRSLQP